MLLSMTGFGKATVVIPGRTITAEVKSLNSKQFDLSTRIPSSLRAHEIDMRNILASKLQRGKADFAITVENTAAAVSCHLNVDNLAAYRAQGLGHTRTGGLVQRIAALPGRDAGQRGRKRGR